MAAADGAALTPGQVLLAPWDRRLVVELGRTRLAAGGAEHGCRPAIDPLFRTAARVDGSRVIAWS